MRRSLTLFAYYNHFRFSRITLSFITDISKEPLSKPPGARFVYHGGEIRDARRLRYQFIS